MKNSTPLATRVKRSAVLFCLLATLLLGGSASPSNGAASVFSSHVPEPVERPDIDLWIGQMLMLGFRGTEVKEGDRFLEDFGRIGPGGVILFDFDVARSLPVRNIVSPSQVQKLVATLQRASEIPLFVAIDQEGGRIARLKPRHGFPETRSQAALGRLDRESETRANARLIAETLAGLGINLNFAPVLDLAVNPDNPIIARLERSFGSNPRLVERHARWTIEEFHKKGVLSALKHFPGHGSSRDDSHLGLPDVTEFWSEVELTPFETLIREGMADMVMTAHLFNSHWDDRLPATLSPQVLNGILRERLGFDGVIVSDDMQMGAITQNFGLEEAIRRSVIAGVDLLVFANNTRDYDPEIGQRAFSILKQLVESGEISRERIRASYQRIVGLKSQLEILKTDRSP